MDINPFEIAGKTVRRTYETMQDTYFLLEDSFCHSFPMNLVFGNADWAETNSSLIMHAADEALRHNDTEEAAHQFRRELYFSGIVDKLAGRPDEAAAQAGLDAVKRHENANAIGNAARDAWNKRLFNNIL